MQTKYSKRFKIEAVKKTLLRGREVSISSVARALDVKISTLHGWIKNMENKKLKGDPTSGGKIQKSPYRRTVKERFEIIVETSNLSQQAIAEYCRKKGIFLYHIELLC